MIPKEWRDYTWKIRPLVVLAWLLVSPAVVLPMLWILSTTWSWPADEDWPAWVQAVGSIVGIFAAWIIPYRHELSREKRQRNAVLSTLRMLSTRQMELYGRMIVAMEVNHELMSWQRNGQTMEWRVHKQTLADFPVGTLIGFDISLLVTLREGADYGLACAQAVMDWDPYKDRYFPPEECPVFTARWHQERVAAVGCTALMLTD